MSVLPTFSSADEAASVASSEIDRLNAFACDGQHFGWYSETIKAMVLKQSVAETFGHIQLGACIFAKFPEACMHMREIVCSVLVKSTSKCGSSNLNIIAWALRSLCKLGCHSSDLQLFSSYLSHHAAVHADAAAPLMLSHRRHHVLDALYYNLIAIHCLSALSMRRIDCFPSSLEVNHSLSTSAESTPETDPKRNIFATNPRSRAPLHSIIQDTQVQRVLSNIQLRALTCIKLLGLSFVSPLEEKSFLLKLLQLHCVSVPFRLQDATFIQQPPRLLLGRLASVVFKSSIHLAVPQPILQQVPDSFRQEFRRLSLDSRGLLDAISASSDRVDRGTISATRSYASKDSASVVVELYRCGYLEKVGGNVKSWHWRWFEIDQIYMSYYRSHYHPDPIKRIQLSDILSVTADLADHKKLHMRVKDRSNPIFLCIPNFFVSVMLERLDQIFTPCNQSVVVQVGCGVLHGRGPHAVLQDLRFQLLCDRRFVYATRVLFYDLIWNPLNCLLDRDHWISAIDHAMHAARGTGMSVWDLEM